jgi:hypothetical protein
MSMCLAVSLDLLLLKKKIVDLLSQYIDSGLEMLSTTLNQGTNFFNHIIPQHDKNSTCIVGDAVIVCLELFHYIAPSTRVKM